MYQLTIIPVLFCSLFSFGQSFVVENNDQNKILYRGFENTLKIGQTHEDYPSYKLETINCEATALSGSTDTYLVKPKTNAKFAQINFIVNGKVQDSTSFVIQNLPSPSLFLGNQESNSKIGKATNLEVKYSNGIALKSDFRVSRWESMQKDQHFEGLGNNLSPEMISYIYALPEGETISIMVDVLSPDGITRKLIGNWIK